MRTDAPGQPSLIVYVFASPYLAGFVEDRLRAELVELCATAALRLVEIVMDHGPPKRRPAEYPALARVARGEADGLLVLRSALFERARTADRLETVCPEGPSAWLTADALAQAGMLPRRIKPAPRSRPAIKRRAAALRAAGLSLRQCARVLAVEGYRRRGGLPWEADSLARLLGLTEREDGQCEARAWSLERHGATV